MQMRSVNTQDIEDLLALIQTESISLAAKVRNCSQSAYTRRVQAIEQQLDTALVDRQKRPSGPTLHLRMLRAELESTLHQIERLDHALAAEPVQNLSIAAQYSISSNIMPKAFRHLESLLTSHHVQMHSGNQTVCLQWLMTEQVSLLLHYETETRRVAVQSDLVTRRIIGIDRFVPVCSREYLVTVENCLRDSTPLALVAYPPTLFLGQIQREALLPKTPYPHVIKITSGLTQAVHQSVENGVGFAWLPRTAVASQLQQGTLVELVEHGFPDIEMELTMLHLNSQRAKLMAATYEEIAQAVGRVLMDTA